jgi:FkbM family methyltransferase
VRYLERSRNAHPHRARMEVTCAVASREPGAPVPFYIDTTWSGRSSALKHSGHKQTEVQMIETTSVDALLDGRVSPSDKMVFKIDVEGFEPNVLEGMIRTLDTVAESVGIIEFNTEFLRKLGMDPITYVEQLASRFHIHLLKGDEAPVRLTGQMLRDAAHREEHMADLVLATREDSLAGISP